MLLTLLLLACSIRITLPMTLFLSATTTNTNLQSKKKQFVARVFNLPSDETECQNDLEDRCMEKFKEFTQDEKVAWLRKNDCSNFSKNLKFDILHFLDPDVKCGEWNRVKLGKGIENWLDIQTA